jgi:hypothetical protein
MRRVEQRRISFDLLGVLTLDAPAIEQLPQLNALALALYACDLAWLDLHPGAPSILDGGVRYQVDPRGVEVWRDVGSLLARGRGDCKAIACAYAAELTRAGRHAVPCVIPSHGDPLALDFHVVVDTMDGERLDPCIWLGMGT